MMFNDSRMHDNSMMFNNSRMYGSGILRGLQFLKGFEDLNYSANFYYDKKLGITLRAGCQHNITKWSELTTLIKKEYRNPKERKIAYELCKINLQIFKLMLDKK